MESLVRRSRQKMPSLPVCAHPGVDQVVFAKLLPYDQLYSLARSPHTGWDYQVVHSVSGEGEEGVLED